jgi:orotidine-5'-phosphate decarboxylase
MHEETEARALRDRYPDTFFLIPGYGAQGGAARVAATLLDRAGGRLTPRAHPDRVEEGRDPRYPRAIGSLTLDDIVASAARAAFAAKAELLAAKKALLG